jgi:hypothetical protein
MNALGVAVRPVPRRNHRRVGGRDPRDAREGVVTTNVTVFMVVWT